MVVLMIIIVLDILLVVAVMYWGAKENVTDHGAAPLESASVVAWTDKAQQVEAQMQKSSAESQEASH